MNSTKFGPIAWTVTHTLPRLVATNGDVESAWNEATIEEFLLYLSSFAMILPCVYCRESYRVFIRVLDLRKWFQGPKRLQPVTLNSVNHYLFTLHNLVNQKLDKRWIFDEQTAIASQVLTDERMFMNNLFEWLYILFCNYPVHFGPSLDEEGVECCNDACRRANTEIFSKHILEERRTVCAKKIPSRCVSKQLARAIEHIKRQVSTISYMSGANEQGVTIGSFINKQLIQPVYENMLSGDIQDAVDLYTFSKVCWYIIMMYNLIKLLLQNAEEKELVTIATRSPEALRALQQLYQTFIEPSRNAAKDSCNCKNNDLASMQKCVQTNLPGWSSSREAIKQIHFARQLWDVKTESFDETLKRIENYRASQHK